MPTNDPIKQREYRKNWRDRNPLKQRTYKLFKKYGLTPQAYNQMLIAQNGLCAICGRSDELLHVDHKHGGGVRALLCQRCNRGIGLFGENPDFMMRAAQYLDKHSGRAEGREV